MLMKNARNRSRKWTAERMDMLGKAVSKPLRDIVGRYKHQLPILHPFEATLADLTVRAREKTGERTLQVRLLLRLLLRLATYALGTPPRARIVLYERCTRTAAIGPLSLFDFHFFNVLVFFVLCSWVWCTVSFCVCVWRFCFFV